MRKPEAKWQTVWGQYLREKHLVGEMYGYYELKQTMKDSLPFSQIEIHQYDGLQATNKTGLVWKFSDEDSRKKPLDCISAPPLPSFLVIKFPDAYYVIHIDKIVKLREDGGISITLKKAREIADKVVILGSGKRGT